MCTGKRQTHIRNVHSSRTVVTGIAPYEAFSKNVRNSEMLQVSREKSRKTEGVFLVASRGLRGKIEIPRARFLFVTFSFGEAKEKVRPHLQICRR